MTGVQTCALPICRERLRHRHDARLRDGAREHESTARVGVGRRDGEHGALRLALDPALAAPLRGVEREIGRASGRERV